MLMQFKISIQPLWVDESVYFVHAEILFLLSLPVNDNVGSMLRHPNASHSSSCSTSLLCLASPFLVHSPFKSYVSPHNHQNLQFKRSDSSGTPILVEPYDYSDGIWIYDPGVRSAPYDHTCKEIFKGWNCIASNKSNGLDIIKWRWKPKGCDLPRFDPVRFLERFRNTIAVLSFT
ncbi:Protein trichome birefringence-like 13 [Vitis vinifera]|uniref:Protein trichome birefringence-like 13 n=1 Tax=Vitis vinifera TaxID=29760 RepID=A0A438JMY3_VITVI|nr:Protein trichome birefringence-like 13 [Vitis vinifera]